MAGSAVLMMVASSVCMKKPTATSQRRLLRTGSTAVGASGVMWR
jgi:hypothetical protein